MKITRHAESRLRQRGFSKNAIEAIWDYGRENFAPGGAVKYFLGKKECYFALRKTKRNIHVLEQAKGGTIVVVDGILITAYKK